MSSSERRTFCRDYAKSALDGAGITCNVTDRSQVMDNADGSSWVEAWVYVPKQREETVTEQLGELDLHLIALDPTTRCVLTDIDDTLLADTPPEEEGDLAPKHFHLRQPELKRDVFGEPHVGTVKPEFLFCYDDCEHPYLPAYEPDCLIRG